MSNPSHRGGLTSGSGRAVLVAGILIVFVSAIAAAYLFRSSLFDGSQPVSVRFDEVVPAGGERPEGKERKDLRVAVAAMISPEITRRYYDDLLGLVGEKLGRRTVLVQRRSYAEVNSLLEHGDIDLAFVCAGPYVQGHDNFGLEILAVPVVSGRKVYNSYIIARKGGPIRSFESLKGRRFAFTDPDSNTGCLVPRYMLARLNETPESYFSETFFTHSHDNSVRAVALGQADGAAVDSLIWDFMDKTDPFYTGKTEVVEKSPPYGIPPVVVPPGLDPVLKADLGRIMLSLHEDGSAKPLLARLQIERFEEGDDSMYDSVREMESWVNDGKRAE